MPSVSDLNNKALQPAAQALQLVSNLAQLEAAAEAAGTTLALAGAMSGVGGAALALIGAILMALDDADAKFRLLQAEVEQLKLDIQEQNVLQRAKDISAIMASCRLAWRMLHDAINAARPVPDDDADNQLRLCMQTLEALVPSDPGSSLDEPLTVPHWFSVRDSQASLYFSTTDLGPDILGYGSTFKYAVLPSDPPMAVNHSADRAIGPMHFSCVLVPDPRPDGFAFCQLSTLPAYLNALALFLAVGVGVRRDFLKQQLYRDEIRRHAKFLASVHQKIFTEGFVFLPVPPDPWGPSNNAWWSGKAFFQGCSEDSSFSGRTAIPLASPYQAPYGCIERFSGDFVVDNFTDGIIPDIYHNNSGPLPRFYAAFLIAELQSGKQLYRQQGLGQVRSTVNSWCLLLGEPELLPDPDYGDWSLRELLRVLDDSSYDPNVRWSLTSLLKQIADTRSLYMDAPPQYPSSFAYLLSLRPFGYGPQPPMATPR